MNVFEILFKVYLLEDINVNDSQNKILKLIDKTLCQDERTLELHNKNEFKNYCFNSFYPLERDGIYKEGNIYTVTIRTVDKYLATYFNNKLANEYTYSIKGLKTELKIIPVKKLRRIYSITPLMIKNDDGYWKNIISFEEFERRLKENLIKKYKAIFQEEINEDFKLYSSIELKNNKPIGIPYKGKMLLGDKISIDILDDDISQKLAYMALGTGMGEMNARGLGFMGYRWI